jgi:hypothetical protein
MSEFNPFDCVEVVTSRLMNEGVPFGSIGYVIERWPDGALEVEVMKADGSSSAQFVAQPHELRHTSNN